MAYGSYAPFYRMGYLNPMQPPIQAPIDNQNMYYQPPMAQPMATAPIPEKSITNDFIWVLNENEATSYPVAPNNSVVLWDKNNPTIYVKSVNSNGMPSMRILDFTERNDSTQNMPVNAPKTHECTCGDKYATKEQINDLRGKIDDLTAKYEELSKSIVEKPKTTTKKARESEE